ncbi:hypothetical protein GQ457_10G007210 [Hibiscus cannabinus]
MVGFVVALDDIPSVDIMIELLHRLKCSSKLNKHLILIDSFLFGSHSAGFAGTQSPMIKDEYYLCHLATGDILIVVVVALTPLGVKGKEAMDKGELVYDDLVVGIIDEIMKKPSSQKGKNHVIQSHHQLVTCQIVDPYFELLKVGPEGGLATSLVTEASMVPLRFTNDLDIDDEGNIYFTDSSSKYRKW